ncbi:DUF6531 domain-containing protein [Kitasatospora arboriphila]
MSNRIVKALEHGAQKLGKTLADDAGKAVHQLYKQAGDNLTKVAKNVREVEAKHAKDLEKILAGHEGKGVPHPRSGGGGRGGRGNTHGGEGRRQVADPRQAGRREDAVCGGGEPVDMATGRMFIDQDDASLPGSLPLVFTRNYESGYLAAAGWARAGSAPSTNDWRSTTRASSTSARTAPLRPTPIPSPATRSRPPRAAPAATSTSTRTAAPTPSPTAPTA